MGNACEVLKYVVTTGITQSEAPANMCWSMWRECIVIGIFAVVMCGKQFRESLGMSTFAVRGAHCFCVIVLMSTQALLPLTTLDLTLIYLQPG